MTTTTPKTHGDETMKTKQQWSLTWEEHSGCDSQGAFDIIHEHRDTMATTWVNDDEEGSDDARELARMFAAAPDLLAALETMCDATYNHGDGTSDGDYGLCAPDWDQVHIARAAIAKAKGDR